MIGDFRASLGEAHRLLGEFLSKDANIESLEQIAGLVTHTFREQGRVYACGNGGSLADAMHFAEEWTGRFRSDRIPYPVIAFSDPTHLTCVANDYGYDQVFSRMVEALGKPGDVLFLLTTSGNSPNLLRAAETARQRGVKTVGFLGKGGGSLKSLCDFHLLAPGETSDRIQEIHMVCLHILIEVVERRLEGNA
ncbi:MAG: SIS domain-containing protein [Fimbriimonadaceae bacterium]|jgi:D-sedoheptulose 7-phosphate isomerase|nr:SIS domain-containing protein [Fimbriimonadaceae bacterium]